jgi:hypothetical protein
MFSLLNTAPPLGKNSPQVSKIVAILAASIPAGRTALSGRPYLLEPAGVTNRGGCEVGPSIASILRTHLRRSSWS